MTISAIFKLSQDLSETFTLDSKQNGSGMVEFLN